MREPERRQCRSSDPALALSLLLDACRERTGLDALVIADQNGLLVSSSTRPGVPAELIAAHLPRTHLREQVPSLHARTFKLTGQLSGIRLFLGAVGATSERLVAELLGAMRGAQRILA